MAEVPRRTHEKKFKAILGYVLFLFFTFFLTVIIPLLLYSMISTLQQLLFLDKLAFFDDIWMYSSIIIGLYGFYCGITTLDKMLFDYSFGRSIVFAVLGITLFICPFNDVFSDFIAFYFSNCYWINTDFVLNIYSYIGICLFFYSLSFDRKQ